MPENKKLNRASSTEETISTFAQSYFLDLGTFEEPSEGAYKNSQEGKEQNPFKWKVIEEYDNFEDAYRGYKAYISKQLTYDRKELEAIWSNGRVDVRLRHGPKMLDWCGIYTRSKIDPEEEDEKQIKGKDPIERQEEESNKKDSLSVNDSVFVKIFLHDSVQEIIPELEKFIDGQLKSNIYNASVKTKLSNLKTSIKFKREAFTMKGVSTVITSSKKDHDKMLAYINKSINKKLQYLGYAIDTEVIDIKNSVITTGIEGSYSKYIIVFTVNGHAARDVDNNLETNEHAQSSLTGNQDRVKDVESAKREALEAFQSYQLSDKEELRDELSRGLRLFAEGKESEALDKRNELLDEAERIFLRVYVLCNSTVAGGSGYPIVGEEVVGQRNEGVDETQEAKRYAKSVRQQVQQENRENKKNAKEKYKEWYASDPYPETKGLIKNYEHPEKVMKKGQNK